MHRAPLKGREISVTRAIPKDQMPPRVDSERRPPPMRPSSRDYYDSYDGYGRAPVGGFGYVPPMRGGGYVPPPVPMRGMGGARPAGFKVSISGLPTHFTWRCVCCGVGWPFWGKVAHADMLPALVHRRRGSFFRVHMAGLRILVERDIGVWVGQLRLLHRLMFPSAMFPLLQH